MINHLTKCFALTLMLAILTNCQVHARDLELQTVVGRTIRVFGHLRLSAECRQGPIPEMTMVQPPSLGALSTKIGQVTLTSPDFGNCSAGHSGNGKLVFYTARMKGTDSFAYKMSSLGQPTTDWIVHVVIK
jgi:hypothetical protein